MATETKETLIRRLLKRRMKIDPTTAVLGPPSVADTLPALVLLGTPEATIVTCVETWAQFLEEGASEAHAVVAICSHRGIPRTKTVPDAIRHAVTTEHEMTSGAQRDHTEWCLEEAMKAYGVSSVSWATRRRQIEPSKPDFTPYSTATPSRSVRPPTVTRPWPGCKFLYETTHPDVAVVEIPSLAGNGEQQWLVNRQDPDSIASCLHGLMFNVPQRDLENGRAARARAEVDWWKGTFTSPRPSPGTPFKGT